MAPRAYATLTAPLLLRWDGEVPEWGRADHPLYRQLGVRLLLTAPGKQLPPPFRRSFADATASIWTRPRALRRLYLAPRPPGAALDRQRLQPDHLTAWPRLPAPARLGSSLYQDGNWRLLLDGHLHPTSPSETLLTAPLPAAARRLDLLYRPRAFLTGMLLAALALASAIAWLTPPPGRRIA
jgi:hypothetical protein